MAGESDFLTRARAAAALLDDEALEALASKGLVRRARKDLETGPPTLIESLEGAVRFQIEEGTVELAEMPSQSRCNCAAGGICRHILAAILFLRETSTPLAATGLERRNTAQDEVLAVTDETLQKWAGKALVRKATQALATGPSVEFDEAGALVIRFPTWNVSCRWLPGGELDGMICSCHAATACEHRVAAVMAYQASHGRRQIVAEDDALGASSGAPRSRGEVLASLGALLCEMVSLGLSRLSESTEGRLRTLAVSAHGVDLPRLERLVRVLADEVSLSNRRDAQAASSRLLGTASSIEALRVALAKPSSDLVGVHRSRYALVGDIDVIGLGARQWRAQSGYLGLTVYFWDIRLKNWVTWSDSRPEGVADFNPASRYDHDGPWNGCDSPAQASRHVLHLMGAWRNRAGRLSGRPGTRCVVVRETKLDKLPAVIADWSDLAERARRLFAGGLSGRDEQDEIVVLRPKRWGSAKFDAVRQELAQPIFDRSERSLLLVMPHSPFAENGIRILEQQDPEAVQGVLGLLRLQREQLVVEPVTLYSDTLINLTLDGRPARRLKGAGRSASTAEDDGYEPEHEPESTHSTSSLGVLLTQVAEHLEAIGESGVRSVRDIERLRTLATKSESLGLGSVSRPIARLADQLDQIRKSALGDTADAARTLLCAHYVVRLAATHEVVAGAIASVSK